MYLSQRGRLKYFLIMKFWRDYNGMMRDDVIFQKGGVEQGAYGNECG